MAKKNIIWFSELNPEYQSENALLNKLKKDSKIEIKNIRFCFEPEKRQESLRAEKSNLANKSVKKALTYEANPEMLFRESYYADGVLATKKLFFESIYSNHLKDIHCPVLTFSEKAKIPKHVLLIITNHPDSVISIKQFCCLFENLIRNNKVTLLILDDGEGLDKPDEKLLVNYIRKWNKNIGVYKEQDWTSPRLMKNLEFDDQTLSVISRNLIVNPPKNSIPDLILEQESASLFIGYTYL